MCRAPSVWAFWAEGTWKPPSDDSLQNKTPKDSQTVRKRMLYFDETKTELSEPSGLRSKHHIWRRLDRLHNGCTSGIVPLWHASSVGSVSNLAAWCLLWYSMYFQLWNLILTDVCLDLNHVQSPEFTKGGVGRC